jgi:hypothetical protein
MKNQCKNYGITKNKTYDVAHALPDSVGTECDGTN